MNVAKDVEPRPDPLHHRVEETLAPGLFLGEGGVHDAQGGPVGQQDVGVRGNHVPLGAQLVPRDVVGPARAARGRPRRTVELEAVELDRRVLNR